MTKLLLIIMAAMPTTTTIDDLLDAIKQVESNGNAEAIGDNGASIGAYQIQRAYFKDAQQHDKSLKKYKYEDVKKDDIARKVIRAYWGRYATKKRLGRKATFEDLARLHNGGCHAYKFQNKKKEVNLKKYWKRVKAQLDKASK